MFLGVKLVVLLAYLFIGYKWNQKNNTSLALRLVFWIVLVRLFLSSFHEYTYNSIAAGLSLISIFSLLFTVISVSYIIYRKYPLLLAKTWLPVNFFILVLVISGLLNSLVPALIEVIKWTLFLGVGGLLVISYSQDGMKRAVEGILVAYSYPVVLLILSIILRVSKSTEMDGSVSYVGGFNHEAAFSVIVFSCFVVYQVYTSLKKHPISLYLIISITFGVLIVSINYRTTVLAYLGMVLILLMMYIWRSGVLVKVLALCLLPFVFLPLSLISGSSLGERFSEIPLFLSQIGELLIPYDYYYRDDRRFFSGRVYIWNMYITAWYEAGLKEHILGFGPGSWKDFYRYYPHNTFVSALYETGLLGLSFLALLFLSVMGLIVRRIRLPYVRVALASYFGFVVLNLATMPLWQIEGLLLFSFVLSLTITDNNVQEN